MITILPFSQNSGDRKACLSLCMHAFSLSQHFFHSETLSIVQPDDVLHVRSAKLNSPSMSGANAAEKNEAGDDRADLGWPCLSLFCHGTAVTTSTVHNNRIGSPAMRIKASGMGSPLLTAIKIPPTCVCVQVHPSINLCGCGCGCGADGCGEPVNPPP